MKAAAQTPAAARRGLASCRDYGLWIMDDGLSIIYYLFSASSVMPHN
jgi:hypothetical protein